MTHRARTILRTAVAGGLLAGGLALAAPGRAVTLAGPVPAPVHWDAPASVAPCSGCHGIDGNSRLEYIPRLSGLNATYVEQQMKAFRLSEIPATIQLPGLLAAPVRRVEPMDGWGPVTGFIARVFRIGFPEPPVQPGARTDGPARINMTGMAHSVDDATSAEIAAWYAAQPPAAGTPADDPALAARGKTLYTTGVAAEGVPPCADCHGADGQGVATFPRLGGQRAAYLRNQLRAFADGDRTHAPPMDTYARHLNADEIAALAAYLETL